LSDYSDAAAGLKTVIAAGMSGFASAQVYDHPMPTVNAFPAFVILPESEDPEIAFGGNSFQGSFRVIVLVCSADDVTGFTDLYDIIDPTESTKSIIAAVRADPTLDGKVDDARIDRVENAGMRQLWGGNFFGADVVVDFVKSVA